MLARIYNNYNETSHYPLKHPSSVYPDSLISDVSICAGDNILPPNSVVIITSAVVKDGGVSVMFSYESGGVTMPLAWASASSNTEYAATIYSVNSNEPIGWISFGSGIHDDGTYIGNEELVSGCVNASNASGLSCIINDVEHKAPSTLNIIFSGCLSIDDSFVIYAKDEEYSSYDRNNPDINGAILTVNRIAPHEPNTLTIKLPVYTDDEGNDTYVYTISSETYGRGLTIITIKEVENADPHMISPFTCPDSDILLERIHKSSPNTVVAEYPLDDFVSWYSDNIRKNNDTR